MKKLWSASKKQILNSNLYKYERFLNLKYKINFGLNYKNLYYELSIIQKSSPGYNIIINDPTIDSNTLEPYEYITYIHNI